MFASHPTTVELISYVRGRVEKRSSEPHRNKQHQNYIMGIVNNDQIYKDVEKLYDGIEQIINTNTNRNCRPINNGTRYGPAGIPHKEVVDEFTQLRSTIHAILRESFTITEDNIPKIKQVYDGVWSVMENNGTDKFQVFTTNYDGLIEEYCNGTSRDLVNGFKPYRHRTGVWSNAWDHDGNKPALYLTKLHGSIFWHKDADGKIVETGSVQPGGADDDIIIAPTEGTKNYDDEPFLALMNHFREALEEIDVLVVVGFSYRDEKIVDAIKRRLKDGMTLISISPTAKRDIEQRVSDDESKPVKVDSLELALTGSGIVSYDIQFLPQTIKDVKAVLEAAYKLIQGG